MFPHSYYLFKHPSFISVVSSGGWLVGRPVGRLMYWYHNEFSIWQPLPLELVPTVVAIHQQAFTGTPRKWNDKTGAHQRSRGSSGRLVKDSVTQPQDGSRGVCRDHI